MFMYLTKAEKIGAGIGGGLLLAAGMAACYIGGYILGAVFNN